MAGVVRRAHEEEGEEFEEGEVWDVLHDHSKEAAAAALSDARMSRKGDKSRQQHEEGGGGAARRSGSGKGRPSAPVAIPVAGCSSRRGGGGGDEEDEEEEMMQLPPHEWLARKMERMSAVSSPDQIGGGRSKGREMRKVRDAVLPKTAFSSEHQ
ncbi:hypothetical protein ABZP36_001325 [Zizania latifolia]